LSDLQNCFMINSMVNFHRSDHWRSHHTKNTATLLYKMLLSAFEANIQQTIVSKQLRCCRFFTDYKKRFYICWMYQFISFANQSAFYKVMIYNLMDHSLCFQALITQCEADVSDHQMYHDQLSDWTDFVQSVRDKLSVCSVTSDEVRAIELQLEYLQVDHCGTCFVVLTVVICCVLCILSSLILNHIVLKSENNDFICGMKAISDISPPSL